MRTLLLLACSCGGTSVAPIANEPAGKPIRAPVAPPCGLADASLVKLDDLVFEAIHERKERRLGSCDLAWAKSNERYEVRERGRLIAELPVTCGIVAYVPGLEHEGLAVGDLSDRALDKHPDIGCHWTIALPAEIASRHGPLSACGERDGDGGATAPRYTVAGETAELAAGNGLRGELARAFFRGKPIVALEVYRSKRCG